jgi:hypothetical protein
MYFNEVIEETKLPPDALFDVVVPYENRVKKDDQKYHFGWVKGLFVVLSIAQQLIRS